METKIKINDPRINVAFENKPLKDVLAFIKENPATLTSERIIKLLKRFAPTDKKDALGSFLSNRYQRNRGEGIWNYEVVKTLLDHLYCFDEYELSTLMELSSTYDEGNFLKFIVKGFSHLCHYSLYFPHGTDYALKRILTPVYLQERIKDNMFSEVVSVVAMGEARFPHLTESDIAKLRPSVFDVILLGYEETNIASAESYKKERIKRITLLWEQCPGLFDFKNLVAVAMSDPRLAIKLFKSVPKEQTEISQADLGKLIEENPTPTFYLVWDCNIPLDESNKEKLYAWLKRNMTEEPILQPDWNNKNPRKKETFFGLMKREKIPILFEDFLEKIIGHYSFDKCIDIKSQYYEKPLMDTFFHLYEKNILSLVNYEYRSKVIDEQKQKFFFNLFFWGYLPWETLHPTEISPFNAWLETYAIRHPKDTVLFARKNKVKLSETIKFYLFKQLAVSNPDLGMYAPFKFRIPGCSNTILVPKKVFNSFLKSDICPLYKMALVPQVKIKHLLSTREMPKGCAWWTKDIYDLMMLEQCVNYTLPNDRLLHMLYTFSGESNSFLRFYLPRLWNKVSSQLDILDLCNFKIEEKEAGLVSLVYLLETGCMSLDQKIIDTLLSLYDIPSKQRFVERISKMNISNTAGLLEHITKKTADSFLSGFRLLVCRRNSLADFFDREKPCFLAGFSVYIKIFYSSSIFLIFPALSSIIFLATPSGTFS